MNHPFFLVTTAFYVGFICQLQSSLAISMGRARRHYGRIATDKQWAVLWPDTTPLAREWLTALLISVTAPHTWATGFLSLDGQCTLCTRRATLRLPNPKTHQVSLSPFSKRLFACSINWDQHCPFPNKMGIQGLTTFLRKKRLFDNDHILKDTILVKDYFTF